MRNDVLLVVLNHEARPLGRAVARREGDGAVVDGDLGPHAHAAVDVDHFEPSVEDHHVLRLHVDVHKALGVEARHGEHDAFGEVPHGLFGERLLLLTPICQEVLQAVLSQLCHHVQHAVGGISTWLTSSILGVVEQLHEELRGLHFLELLVPQGLVRGHLEVLLQLLEHCDLPLVLLHGRGLNLSATGLLLVDFDGYGLAGDHVLALSADGRSAFPHDVFLVREHLIPSEDGPVRVRRLRLRCRRLPILAAARRLLAAACSRS
mmetsp:Transcript_140942/g.358165  ORF Transcript_140942/g.358165 Transcript_140942/m.358165 type:complete len:263 (-) Transcript_140942:118-906(-)